MTLAFDIPTAITPAETAAMREHAHGRLVLEIGALLGYSTCVLAEAALHVVSVDPHEGYPVANPRPTLDAFLNNLYLGGVRNKVTPVIGRDDILPMLAPQSFGMAFIDTTGEFDDTYRIMHSVIPHLRHYAVLAVHDCGHPDWPGALEAVEKFSTETGRPYDLTDRLAVFEGCWH